MTLCSRCLDEYKETDEFDIRRDRSNQTKEICCKCNSKMGFDYFVERKPQSPRRRKGA